MLLLLLLLRIHAGCLATASGISGRDRSNLLPRLHAVVAERTTARIIVYMRLFAALVLVVRLFVVVWPTAVICGAEGRGESWDGYCK